MNPLGAPTYSESELIYYYKMDRVEYAMASRFASENVESGSDFCPLTYELFKLYDGSNNPVTDSYSGITLQTDPADPNMNLLSVYYAQN